MERSEMSSPTCSVTVLAPSAQYFLPRVSKSFILFSKKLLPESSYQTPTWFYTVNLIMKSRVMGDYQARFCERFGSEIPPYLLDRVTTTLFSYINCYCSLVFSFPNCHCVKVNVASLHEQVHLCFNFFSLHLSKSWN